MAGVDVILDCMGASYYQRNLDSLNFDGRLFIIGFQGGVSTQADLRPLLAKRLTVQGIAIFGLYPLSIYALDHIQFLLVNICMCKYTIDHGAISCMLDDEEIKIKQNSVTHLCE